MAPEQMRGLGAGRPRADIWAFGVVAYECLTGRRPFDDESIGKLLVRVLSAAPPPPASSLAPVPALFDDWFRVACAREPGDRFPDVQTAASALALALDAAILAALPQAAPSPGAYDAAPTLSSLRVASPAAAQAPSEPPPAPSMLPANMSPLAATLDPPALQGPAASGGSSRAARPAGLVSEPAPLHVSQLLRVLPALSAVAAAVLAMVLAGRDAPGRPRAPVALVHATARAKVALPPIDALLVHPAPVLIEPAVASACVAPEPPAPPSVASPGPRARRRPSEATPSRIACRRSGSDVPGVEPSSESARKTVRAGSSFAVDVS